MKIFLLICILVLVTSCPASGRDGSHVLDALRFTLGAGSSIATHEASHYLVARVQGLEVRPHGLGWETNRPTTAFQMAGLAGNALSSEFILLIPRGARGSFLNGWLVTNIVEQLTYSTLRRHDRKGDFGPLSESKKRIFAAVYCAEALFAAYRMCDDVPLRIPLLSKRLNHRPMIGIGVATRTTRISIGE